MFQEMNSIRNTMRIMAFWQPERVRVWALMCRLVCGLLIGGVSSVSCFTDLVSRSPSWKQIFYTLITAPELLYLVLVFAPFDSVARKADILKLKPCFLPYRNR